MASGSQAMKALVLMVLLATGARGQEPSSTPQELKPIRQLVSDFVSAWNAHDAHAMAGLFAENAEFRGFRGASAHGRREIEQIHQPMFDTVLKESQFTALELRARFTDPGTASAKVLWEMNVAPDRNGKPVALRRGVLSWNLSEQDGRWLISTMQNHEFSGRRQCVNQGIDERGFAPLICWMQQQLSWRSDREPYFWLIGNSKGANVGLAWPPYLVVNVPEKKRRWRMFRMGFRYDRTWRGYIFPTMAAKSIEQPLRY